MCWRSGISRLLRLRLRLLTVMPWGRTQRRGRNRCRLIYRCMDRASRLCWPGLLQCGWWNLKAWHCRTRMLLENKWLGEGIGLEVVWWYRYVIGACQLVLVSHSCPVHDLG